MHGSVTGDYVIDRNIETTFAYASTINDNHDKAHISLISIVKFYLKREMVFVCQVPQSSILEGNCTDPSIKSVIKRQKVEAILEHISGVFLVALTLA